MYKHETMYLVPLHILTQLKNRELINYHTVSIREYENGLGWKKSKRSSSSDPHCGQGH